MAQLEERYSFVSYDKERINVETLLSNYLNSIKKQDYFDKLNYILKELATNGEKANLKRIFFKKNNLDINKSSDYEKGMKSFRENMLFHYDEYIELADELGYMLEICLNLDDNKINLSVLNSVNILPIELTRINEKFKLASRFNSMEEVIDSVLDQTEGAGFGIILTILILRKLGLDEKVFNILNKSNSTISQVNIPLDLISSQKGDIIAADIINEVNEVPQFPKHLMEVINVLNNPNSTFDKIGDVIKKDPAFIAELIKIANSPIYALPKKVENTTEAVRLIGIRGIKNFVLTYSTNNVLMNKYNLSEIKIMMKHASEVAFFAQELARVFNLKTIMDNVFASAMLHDLGKIIVRGIKPDLVDKIQKLCQAKGINNFMVESLTDGYNHSIIGAKLAEKWNFPDFLIETIKFHHIPLEAKDENIKLVSLIYLADLISYYKDSKFKYEDINFKVLKNFNINSKDQFEGIILPIIKKFFGLKDVI
ncbi:MAG: hypothetical protein A2086_02065 [Spirochaetes bacterium GWD1_27_9]|nr:MAG: hypothetical protein A2Z98_06765 [Spirochaetes bacterium GWB1_27_13]OHD27505.1 MAG: hypothetical protein A2Y34_04600 [Spirochaetes bacterium GWC1_27_15]OHD41699.1 MAG: hypothetical protein A2086_02065 [Spirochaetes bacterium GWD1_27_9]